MALKSIDLFLLLKNFQSMAPRADQATENLDDMYIRVYISDRTVGMAKADSLKETVVKYPYLFGSQGLSVPSSYLVSPPSAAGERAGRGRGEETDTGSLNRKKAISSECLHLIAGSDTTPSRESREGKSYYFYT